MCNNFSFLCLALLLLLVSLKTVAGRSTGHINKFESLMNSGDHKGAHHIAEELTRQMPNDGYSWCVARVNDSATKVPRTSASSNALFRYLLAIALEVLGKDAERMFQVLQQAVNCHHYPPPPPAHLRLKQMYEDRGQMEEAGYMLLAGAEAHPDNYQIWMEMCFLLLRMLSRSCLRVCQTAMRLSSPMAAQDRAYSGLNSGGPQEAIGIFALSDHQPDIGLFWLLRSMHAQLKLHRALRPRLRTTFWALVARARLLAWDISIPQSDDFFSKLTSFPAKEIYESIVAFHFLEAGGPPEMVLWLMTLLATK
jgi:hypothetical protein